MVQPVIMVSACLLGVNCRYDGTSKLLPELAEVLKDYQLIPFCPEQLGGLLQPRPAAEIKDSTGAAVWAGTARVINQAGRDCTTEFIRGAQAAAKLAIRMKPVAVVLKANSPSCGVGQIYDGSFQGRLRDGDGVTTALLRQQGLPLYTEMTLLADPGRFHLQDWTESRGVDRLDGRKDY